MSAASVIAAGSVINEPNKGTSVNKRKYLAELWVKGRARASVLTRPRALSITGRLAATTMIANTNRGSV